MANPNALIVLAIFIVLIVIAVVSYYAKKNITVFAHAMLQAKQNRGSNV